MAKGSWRFWIDRGGTFTDVVARSPQGALLVEKVLSVQPDQPGDPAVRAIRRLLGLDAAEAHLPEGWIEEVRLGTTVATNAFLEQSGAPALLLVNQGFADLLRIGDQHRPDLFALAIERPAPLYQRVLEIPGRIGANGEEVEPLQFSEALHEHVLQAWADGVRSVSVALLHSVVNPSHEKAVGAWLASLGFDQIALSHQVSPLPRLVPRGYTTVLEAAVAPVLSAYLQQLQADLGPHVPLQVMQSSGMLTAPQALHAKDTILSGPAGGLVGAARTAAAAGGHVHRCLLRGGRLAPPSAGGVGRRSDPGADAGDPHRGGRWWLLCELRWSAAGGGSGFSWRRSRAGWLPARRPAHGHGCQLAAGPAAAAALPGCVWP
jgi:5-oxoprolinase (ATP-hydrolysing)